MPERPAQFGSGHCTQYFQTISRFWPQLKFVTFESHFTSHLDQMETEYVQRLMTYHRKVINVRVILLGAET